MNNVRGDIAAAAGRMRVVFGTRSAMKHLVHSLEAGEQVREMVACLFAGANGLLVLTDRRVLALRDDYSRYSMKAAALPEITLIDYGPKVHDGFAVFTDTGRVAVRKMNREDSDRFVEVLTQTLPGVPVVTSHPSALASKKARHARKIPVRQVVSAPDVAAEQSVAESPTLQATVTVTGPDGSDTRFIADVPTAPVDPGTSEAVAPAEQPSPPPVVPAPVPEPIPAPTIPETQKNAVPTDKEVLYGVLADLHARGLLTAEELAVKVAAVASTP